MHLGKAGPLCVRGEVSACDATDLKRTWGVSACFQPGLAAVFVVLLRKCAKRPQVPAVLIRGAPGVLPGVRQRREQNKADSCRKGVLVWAGVPVCVGQCKQ
eukprot:11187213-Lingulodinium_polyedra.AAC.1